MFIMHVVPSTLNPILFNWKFYIVIHDLLVRRHLKIEIKQRISTRVINHLYLDY